MINKRSVGKKWENFAAELLRRKGYKILVQNWTCRWGEIDIIAADIRNNCLVFVEVKFSHALFGYAHEAVNFHKLRALRRAAQFYIQKENPGNTNFRFDVVAVTSISGKLEINHFRAIDA